MSEKEKPSVDFAFLDSGTGGIPYMISLKEKNPHATCVYLGDTMHFPYGEKTCGEITEAASQAVALIVEKWNPKTVIVACNTISVTALDFLRDKFPSVPIVGTVPAVKLAGKITRNKRIGFLATTASVNHPYSQKLIDDFAGGCRVFKRGDPGLIDFIEKKFWTADDDERRRACAPALEYFRKNGCDTVILGCTHFTHIAKLMQEEAGENMKIIDSRDGVSNQALRVEKEAEKNMPQNKSVLSVRDMSFFVTKATDAEEEAYKTLCRSVNIPWGGVVALS